MISWSDLRKLNWQLTEYLQYEWKDSNGNIVTLIEPGLDDISELYAQKFGHRSMGGKKIRFPIPCDKKVYNKAIEFAERYLEIPLDELKA